MPNGTTATTQGSGDNTTKLATDAFVQANAAHAICSERISPHGGNFLWVVRTGYAATCTGLLTTDNIALTFNGSPIGITGYAADIERSSSDDYTWPTANTINVAVGNSSGSSITPGSATVNYRVVR